MAHERNAIIPHENKPSTVLAVVPAQEGPLAEILQLLENNGSSGSQVGQKMFSRLAAHVLMHEYELAKAETSVRWWSSLPMAYVSFTHMGAKAMIPVGLVSALAIDFAIFGGSASSLIATNWKFSAMALGSLITAGLIGTVKGKAARTGLIVTATGLSLAAGLLATSAAPDYTADWAKLFTGQDADYNALNAELQTATAQKEHFAARVAELTTQVNTGGVGGKHVMVDGNAANDYLALKDLPEAKTALDGWVTRVAELKPAVDKLADARPSLSTGRWAAAGFLGTMLTLAQLSVANAVDKAPQWVKDARDAVRDIRAREDMVRGLASNSARAEMRLAEILSYMKSAYLGKIASSQGEEAMRKVEAELFSEAGAEKMIGDAADIFGAALGRKTAATPQAGMPASHRPEGGPEGRGWFGRLRPAPAVAHG